MENPICCRTQWQNHLKNKHGRQLAFSAQRATGQFFAHPAARQAPEEGRPKPTVRASAFLREKEKQMGLSA
ncbi:MAG: hypothetical protein LBB46_02790 [Coriobacteriaceae bacterium]|jgi:hypothetical protein|nr:hypothetical protein [Coriobacteriaceae bacterium]